MLSGSGDSARLRAKRRRVFVVSLLAVLAGLVGAALTRAAPSTPSQSCTLVPQLRDVTVNQGVGAYSLLVNGKETLARFFLSMPSCAGSGASIQITGGTLTVSGGGSSGTVTAPTPVPSPTAYPVIATFTAAPMADSTGDPKFVVPATMVSRTVAFTASFSTTLSYRSKATRSGSYGSIQQITFSNRPGTTTPITAAFDRPSNAIGILFVPMGDGTKAYNTQWTTTGQQALQDGMTAAVARQYPLPGGIGNLGGTAGLRYMVTPTLLDLKRLNLLDGAGKFCGTGANYDAIKAELAQFRLSHNSVNPSAQANRVVGIVDPAVGLGPPSPCFEGMAVVNSQEAWALARAGRAGQLIGLELAHTLGLTPPNRESPFDGAHSQNVAAENPSLNRRYNVVQRSFIVTDRNLLKPSGTSPAPDNVNTLLEVPDFRFLLCVFGGTPNTECQASGPGTVNASAPVAATLSFVMSGITTGAAGISPVATATGAATGTSVVESYFASTVPQTAPIASSIYRLVQRATGGSVLSDQGVPVNFLNSGHRPGQVTQTGPAGLFSLALPFQTNTDRIELWKGAPGASGSLLLYARNRTSPPIVTSFSVGGGIDLRAGPRARPLILATYSVTNTNDSGAGSLRDAITQANTNPGADTIDFNIAGDGVHTITPLSALPDLAESTTVDGTTESDYVAGGAPRIELNGASAGSVIGLRVEGSNSVVRGLTINRFASFAIYIDSTASNTRIEGNYIGLDATGAADAGSSGGGIQVLATGCIIGGTATGQRNVIGGVDNTAISIPGGSATVQGNYIGTSADGLSAVGNLEGIVLVSNGNQIGGSGSGEGNVLSGSLTTTGAGAGVSFSGSVANNTIEGNLIGTNKDGTGAIPNSRRGILAQSTGANNVIRGNVISGNNGDGIMLAGSGVIVVGNLIGTNAAGAAALPNTAFGLQVIGSGSNTIGGTASGAGNVISGNASGGVILNSASNQVLGNSIGTTATGSALPNAFDGIRILVGATNNVIGGEAAGASNRISNNGRNGVRVESGTANRISANQISANGALGIDLSGDGVTANDAGDGDSGPNNLQNYPVVTSAEPQGGSVRIQGTLSSSPSTMFRLDFYANVTCDGSDFGEGERWIGWGMTTTNASGVATFDTGSGLTAPTSPGEWVTATAADPSGNTSEFSECVQITGGGGGTQPGPTFTINTNSDGTPADAGCTTTECTLREAITAANAQAGANTIEFDIGGDTQIALQDALPSLTGPVLIDGLSQPEGTIVINGDGAGVEVNGLQLDEGSSGSEIRGLEIRDFFTGAGIMITSASNTIASNTIHLVNDGITVNGGAATGNVIGQNAPPDGLFGLNDALGNVLVDADSDGIEIINGASGTVVAANYIGTDRAGATTRGNGGAGIRVSLSSNNQLGPGNKVARNGSIGTGIAILSGSGNRVVANSIDNNLGKGISLGSGANGDITRPNLTSAALSGGTTTVSGSVSGVADGAYFVEFFKNTACDSDGAGFGEGEAYVDFTTVTVSGGSGSFSKGLGGLALGNVVTATLTGTTTDNTSEFSNCVTVEESLPPGQEQFDATSTDDNPADNTLDLYLDCGAGKPIQVIAVGLLPDDVTATTASWSGNYDSTLAPANCALKAVVMDGVNRSGFTSTGTETVDNGPNALVAAVSSPREGATFLQYGLIALRGSVRNADGELFGAALQWTLAGPGISRSGTGPIVDQQPPASGGWPNGTYTATLTTPGAGPGGTDTVTFNVLTDADNDGMSASVESQSCFGADADNDPLNADDDSDGDGLVNANDPQPCVPATSYTAIVDFNPDPLPTGSSGNTITVDVRVPGRNVAQVLASSVRITRIADENVSTDPRFANIGWTVKSGVGIAKFDRLKLVQYLASRNIRNRVITVTVAGGKSSAPPWSFEGSDTTFVQG